MKKIFSILCLVVAALGLASCSSSKTAVREKGDQAMNYRAIVEGYDWGPAISRLVIDLGQAVRADSIDAADFKVEVERRFPGTTRFVQVMDWAAMASHDSRGERPVLAAYLSDADGERIPDASGSQVTLALKIGPGEELASPFNFDMASFLNSYVEVWHSISLSGRLQLDSGPQLSDTVLCRGLPASTLCPIARDFDTSGVSDFKDPKYGPIKLTYASWTPPVDGRKHPLIIWLHGAGEGGSDPNIALLGNRVTALASEPIQGIMGGAFVLVPQTPRVWMNNGVQSYPEDGSTQYTLALKQLIDSYLAKTPDIDTRRIYVGGCSNGGFMTVRMILSYPDFFAAAWPVCEAFADRWISPAQLQSIKNLPIWFTQAKTDNTVKAAGGGYVIQTYQRLLAAGGQNIHLSYWDKVEDLSGLWFKPDGATPWEYDGHWSWIPALNNQCRLDFSGSPVLLAGRETSLFEWLAAQSR